MNRHLELDTWSELHKRPQSRRGQLKSLPPWLARATLEIREVHQMTLVQGALIDKHELLGLSYEALTLA